MITRLVGMLLLFLGLVAAFLAIAIDPLRGVNFHLAPLQIIAFIAGLVITAQGFYLLDRRRAHLPPDI